MKRAIPFLVPPLAFGLTAVLAWLTGTPASVGTSPGDSSFTSPRQRVSREGVTGDTLKLISDLERKVLHSPAPPRENPGLAELYDPDRWEGDLLGDRAEAEDYSLSWADAVPEEMFAWLTHKPTPSPARSRMPAHALFKKWAGKDMPGALAAVATIPDPGIRAQALMASLEVLCKSDPARARELLVKDLSLFSPDQPALVFERSEAGESTADLLLSLPPGSPRSRLLAELLKGMTGNKPEEGKSAAQAVWERTPQELRKDLVAAGFSSDSDDPVFTGLEELMRERAETSGDPMIADKFINSQGLSWVRHDPAAALEWARTHLRGRSRAECGEWLFEAAADVDFDAALKACRSLPDGMIKIRAAEAITRGAPESRKAEAEALSEGVL